MTEAANTRRVLLEAARAGLTLYRTNAGRAWQGSPRWIRTKLGRALVLEHPRVIHLLPEGFFDFAGWDSSGRFVGVEMKSATGKARKAQLRFQARVRAAGGRAIIAREPGDLYGD